MNKFYKSQLKNFILDLYWAPQIPFLSNPIPEKLPDSILFVCKGNICRSPFAEHLAIKIAKRMGHDMNITSAGLNVTIPLSSPKESIAVARAFDVDLSQHKSRRLDETLIKNSMMIVVMEPNQIRQLREVFPQTRNKIWLLSLFEKKTVAKKIFMPHFVIQDPYGCSLKDFDVCYKGIERCLTQLFYPG